MITLESVLPDLNNNITINGPRAATSTVQRDSAASSAFRIFTVDAGKTVSLSGLTIAGGLAENGGGIANSGTMTVKGCTFTSKKKTGIAYWARARNSASICGSPQEFQPWPSPAESWSICP
jgi:hypothetical protein